MTGEIAVGGVAMPALLALAIAALLLTGVVASVLSAVGAYRWIAYRPLADLAIFVLLLGLLSRLTG